MPPRSSRIGLALLLVLLAIGQVGLAAPAEASDCTPGQNGCLPDAEDCATGEHNGVTLGETFLAAAACVGAGGQTLLYAGGLANPLAICGTIVVANQVLNAQDPNDCANLEPMFPRTLRFRAILPAGYTNSTRRYPVVYLLAGGGGDQDDWLGYDPNDPKLLATLANRGVIVVSVFTGLTFHTNWRGDPHKQYASMFVRNLIPAVDGGLRTIANRSGRAVAGFSMGGYGALIHAAHNPHLFSAVGGFSAVADTMEPDVVRTWWLGPLTADGTYENPVGQLPWGHPHQNEVWWRDANPVDLAAAYRRMDVWLSVGNGVPTPEDVAEFGPFLPLAAEAEVTLMDANRSLASALGRAGVEYELRVHDGVHATRHAANDLRNWFPVMLKALGKGAQSEFETERAVPSFAAHGWTFRADPRRAPEFLRVTKQGSRLILEGSGRTTVTTPGMFRPGSKVEITGANENGAIVLRADRAGRVTFVVDLGEPHQDQQFTPQARIAELAGGYWTTRTITVR